MKTIKSIKNKFIKSSTPGIGRITFDINFDTVKHIKEIEMALVLKNMFGGNIKLLQENDYIRGVKYPDYLWNGKYWELKNCSSLTSIDKRLHIAIKQLRDYEFTLIGGVILDCSKVDNDPNKILNLINKRLSMSCNFYLTIIIKLGDNKYELYEYKQNY